MDKRKFTIVATVRNEAASIRAFVESLLTQTRVPDEILIVDGDSTDGTREILEDYAKRDLLRVISQPCNIAEGRNLGIAAATGTHLAVTDAGCRVDPDWLANIDRCFDSDCRPDVVAGNFRFETHTPFEEAVVRATFQPNRDDTEAARYYPSSRSVAFTKAAWQLAGGYPEWLYAAEDTLFNIRLRQLGHRFVFCQDAVVRWRPRESWRQLARQRINFSRGNARVGIGLAGYLANLRIHGLALASLLLALVSPLLLLITLLVIARHIQVHLWSQATASTAGDGWPMRLRVLAVMEFVRLVNLYGFILGRLDRKREPEFVEKQIAYMGVASVDDLDFENASGNYRKTRRDLTFDVATIWLGAVLFAAIASALAALMIAGDAIFRAAFPVGVVASSVTLALLIKSLIDFTHTGPTVKDEILGAYRRYTFLALSRLALWAFFITFFTGSAGAFVYGMLAVCLDHSVAPLQLAASAGSGIAAALLMQFTRKLRFNPGLLVASMQYRVSRIYWLWRLVTPRLILIVECSAILGLIGLFWTVTAKLADAGRTVELFAWWSGALFYVCVIGWIAWEPDARPVRVPVHRPVNPRPNILMIGSDTLRADRLAALGYHRVATPNIDLLGENGALFANCYVPCARTAPSLISMLSGTWPHTHGIRDNFVASNKTRLEVPTLPSLLNLCGYRTAAISDWCGGDMGKFSFGFTHTDLPEDQWNIKYLIRQGPKDLRLFVSLFLNNRLGREFVPEIYYLGGVPLTRSMGKRARRLVSRLASSEEPFFLNLFYSTTHPPFASEWPWYVRFADRRYAGESKFAMARLTDPFEIIRRQGAPKEEFDLDQVIDLYDGCVAAFDDEVRRMLAHLSECGLSDNTIVVVYSDHGMELFEHDTWGQGNSAIGEASPRIPLVLFDPRLRPRGCVESVVRSIDLAPTILNLIDVEVPPSMEGVSLAPFLRAEADCPRLDAFTETGIWIANVPGLPHDHLRYPDLLDLIEVPDHESGTLAIKNVYESSILAAKDRMIRRGCWKLVYQPLVSGHVLLLFNVESDALCQHDLAAQNPEIVEQLWAELAKWINKSE